MVRLYPRGEKVGAAGPGDRGFRWGTGVVAWLLPVLLLLIVALVAGQGWPALQAIGPIRFLKGSTWDPVHEIFGALPFLYGTLVSSLLALAFALPVGAGCALFLAEPGAALARRIAGSGVEMLAAVPSVVYGIWGLNVLAPWLLAHVAQPIVDRLGGAVPFLAGPPGGANLFAASAVLAVMILPTQVAISRDVIRALPLELRAASLALGATWWETIWKVVLPAARAGILGATVLAFGRALGETMAVTMVIGNRPALGGSLFAPAYTLASVIASEFNEATDPLHTAALLALGLLLIVVTLLINGCALLLIRWVKR